MLTQDKLSRYLEIAEEVCTLVDDVVKEISRKLKAQGQELSLRERLLVGLAKKTYRAFRCIVEDARKGQPEAMHHLKTMVESFIYLHFAGKGKEDINTRLVRAKGVRAKINFFEKNPEYPEQEKYLKTWGKEFDDITKGIEIEWKDFDNKSLERIAGESGLESIYQRIYRLACETAHIADLQSYMPPAEGPINFDQITLSELSAFVALDYGLFIMCALLEDAYDFFELNFRKKISELRTKITTIRNP